MNGFYMEDSEGMFSGINMPEVKSNKKRRGRNIFLSKEQKIEIKVRQQDAKIARLNKLKQNLLDKKDALANPEA